MNDNKQRILEEIRSSVDVFRSRGGTEYSIRCPLCGDSQTDPRDSHCYIKCSYDPTEPMVYKCFKCNAGGVVNEWFLRKLNMKPDTIALLNNSRYSKLTHLKQSLVDLACGNVDLNSPQVKYIERRLGKGFSLEDYEKFKIVWDDAPVKEYITNKHVLSAFPSIESTISFISDNQCLLLNRTFFEDEDRQWKKITLMRSDNKAFYTIKTQINLLTLEPTVVNIAEGVFDILSVYKNFNDCENSAFIATLGSDYISAVNYAIAKGLMGSNTELRLYIDNGIGEKQLKYGLKRFKWIFKSIRVYRNVKSKDVGVPIDQIQLTEYRI